MKKLFKLLVITFLSATALPALSNTSTDVFAACMVDNINDQEKKLLSQWTFFSIASHPDIQQFTKIGINDIENTDKAVAKVITRLLTENCAEELKTASKANPQALQNAFALLGQVAMQALVNNNQVIMAISNYTQYLEQDKIMSLIQPEAGK